MTVKHGTDSDQQLSLYSRTNIALSQLRAQKKTPISFPKRGILLSFPSFSCEVHSFNILGMNR